MGKTIGIITSRGGHLYQIYRLKPWWRKYDRFWVTFPGADALSLLSGETVYWGYPPDTRNVLNALRHLVLAWRILTKERPTILLSCGAGIAPPFFAVAKLLGIKTVFVEVYDLLSHPSVSGRLISPIADVFLVQHERQKRFFPKAIYKGAIL
jgi:UDP-N-acetylglucosamine:LPS N-acetylglucosamine transferase